MLLVLLLGRRRLRQRRAAAVVPGPHPLCRLVKDDPNDEYERSPHIFVAVMMVVLLVLVLVVVLLLVPVSSVRSKSPAGLG